MCVCVYFLKNDPHELEGVPLGPCCCHVNTPWYGLLDRTLMGQMERIFSTLLPRIKDTICISEISADKGLQSGQLEYGAFIFPQ